ncbi:glucans biosynthesis glucosyltransferase MdoH [Stutzerimonas xanthomarina]|uniref:glucans biosynthesis glucosyltransferase MdoH n=1 Tax=Stutzerimonas xanthomarina TaxID=271420 RepID=UPI000E90B993|nr:glucans biosynthesis glucosyltransferase MdoH [Stutzerimonas xanthomarina]MBU0853548.1 glucans biosynthesis glucosyltransferase MdoH [Gammaproteobacteria bacterium]HAW25232.1 glucans biosynthesis glucosyltransferase MdoH [Pseudomonas sp.]MBK3848326.1 glucans biosynthesis glucosyltransferase MdoH [Stutzerimonas xanthomarina]MBU1774272.1 glucans biosynthesis glucosyltransferase MdoH [Gammaproteobacteria bacterium]HCC60935.1 glucans biosynthesis glucosyltransferase MdoH [Pseudomonas sp.]|tara:strand:+ start:12435 stop:15020 length:2586 start_codon:yes stop_codon:yes gene_type:complete
MNSPVDPAITGRYISQLPLDDPQRQALIQNLEQGDGGLADIHRALGRAVPTPDSTEPGGGALLGSVAARLKLGWGETLERAKALTLDHQGRTCIESTPPIVRTRMVPEPWHTNVLRLSWWRLLHKKNRTVELPPAQSVDRSGWRKVAGVRRATLLVLMLVQTVIATWHMKSVLPYQGWALIDLQEVFQQPLQESARQILPYVVQTSILLLFALLFCWVSVGFWTALMGFFQLLKGHDQYNISATTLGDEPIPREARTALVMPIANEDVPRVFAGLRATFESLKATGQLEHFDIFVLSDSNDPDTCVAEQKAWLEVCRSVDGFGHIFYRRRRRRVKRKSGNIDDFCRRWGSSYRYMVVLDADSVMSGDCLTSLVRLMEANPGAGIIQTAPKASGMDTLYARMQQFATRVYGPLFTAGLNFWQLGESHYWGHNAIIRVKPFIEHCALAPLPGKGAFAGDILSHDFVEAALMRRAGWGVWIAYDLPGSYEELPPNLLDELKRDRRWCHGNLMNFRLFLVKGMHTVHRFVFLTGVMSYLSAPLWFVFLALSTGLLAIHTLMVPEYFLQPNQLYPLWPQWHPQEAIALFSATLTLLFLPKLLSVLLICIQGAHEYGGRARLLLSMLLESLFSMLAAPVRMLFHTVFVSAAFLGWSVQWNSPQRADNATPWSEALRRHGPQMLLGVLWMALVGWLDPAFLWWLAPIVVSLILSAPVSVITSRTGLGQAAFRRKLFLIPEEFQPPQELASTDRYTRENQANALANGFIAGTVDPIYNALVCGMARARHAKVVAGAESLREQRMQQILDAGPNGAAEAARWRLLNDPDGMAQLHSRVWQDQRYQAWRDAYRPSDFGDASSSETVAASQG